MSPVSRWLHLLIQPIFSIITLTTDIGWFLWLRLRSPAALAALAMPVCNLGEVYYDFFRTDGLSTAQTAWTNTLALPLTLRYDADDTFIQRVGIIKVEERIPFADAFAGRVRQPCG